MNRQIKKDSDFIPETPKLLSLDIRGSRASPRREGAGGWRTEVEEQKTETDLHPCT